MSALGEAEGYISKQSASYRQGLVLGLTMAEVMILLVFCLLIALAAFLKTEHSKRVEVEEQLRKEREAALANADFVELIKRDPRLIELVKSRTRADDQGRLDEFWRELIEGGSVAVAAQRNGLTTADIRSHMADIKTIKEKGLDLNKVARHAAITASVDKAVVPAGSATPEYVATLIERGLKAQAPVPTPGSEGHKWPPIIALNDAKDRFFKSGSAEVDPEFRRLLLESTASHIVRLIKEYDVDVIEVVGHTDEQPIGNRPSNLDLNLVSVLSNGASIAAITPADNAGLGLARAVSVVDILRQSKELAGYKILPLSGGQLINTDETLALGGNLGDIRERRRIEIRLRKATPRVTDQAQQQTGVQKLAKPVRTAPLRPPKPARPTWTPPLISGPMQIVPRPPSISTQPQY